MNRKFYLAICAVLSATLASAQTPDIFSVVACPGEDVSHSVNISWGADSASRDSYVIYTPVRDRDWKRAERVYPVQRFCTTYDSVYSKNAAGENFYEMVRFNKCDASLTGLRPDTEYKYRVVSGEGSSAEHRFKTAGDKRWSVCLISDYHCYPPLPARLESAMNMIETVREYDPEIDWILHLGDVCAWGGSYSFWRGMYEEKPFADYMWAGVNGNHDNMTRNYRLTNEFFRDAAFYPRNGYEGEEGVCYHFRYGDVLFIMLNSEDMRSDEGLAAARKWVREVIEQNPTRYTVVCEHYQWFFGQDGNSSQYSRWSDLFDELGVDLALAGNNHIYVRSYPILGGEVTDGSSGTVYVQTPSSDNERGAASMGEIEHNEELIASRWFEGPKTVGAMHMSVSPKEMVLTLLDRNGTVLDTVSVKTKRK